MRVDQNSGLMCRVFIDGQDVSDICLGADDQEGWVEVAECVRDQPKERKRIYLPNGVAAKAWVLYGVGRPEGITGYVHVRWPQLDHTCPEDLAGIARTIAFGHVVIMLTGQRAVAPPHKSTLPTYDQALEELDRMRHYGQLVHKI